MKKENDPPNLLAFYGKSKLTGDAALNNLASCPIVKTSITFGLHKTKQKIISVMG